ncbi:MAG: hypothetical protein V1816_20625 [Pseudomonadota bacterium]
MGMEKNAINKDKSQQVKTIRRTIVAGLLCSPFYFSTPLEERLQLLELIFRSWPRD